MKVRGILEGYWKHGDTEGCKKSLEYVAWCKMLQRCYNPNDPDYKNYGGRGISVCKRWLVYENFLADMKRKPSSEYTLGRIKNEGNYEPNNCEWQTRIEQGRDKRGNRLTLDGARKIRVLYYKDNYGAATIARWFGVAVRTIWDVIWGKTWKEG